MDTWNDGRRGVAQRYADLFAGRDDIVTPEVTDEHVFHQYTVRLLDVDRDAVRERMTEAGVSTMVYYPVTIDQMPLYAGMAPEQPVSKIISREVLSLPIWPELEAEVQERIASALIASVDAVRGASDPVPELAGDSRA